MTNKQTIDGVSGLRALLAEIYNHHGTTTDHRNRICALLMETPAAQPQGEPVAEIVEFGEGLKEVSWRKGRMPALGTKLYTEQPQGEVQRLSCEVSKWRGTAGRLTHERDEARAQLAERDALLREIAGLDPRGEFLGWQLDGKIDVILSTSAEPKPRCEAVAWRNVATGHVTSSPVVVMDWDDENEEVQSLYAEQPAPSHYGDANEMVAKVVLPDQKVVSWLVTKAARQADLTHGANYHTAAEFAAEAVISEVAKLNGIKP